jgi:hypothetical protein
MNDWTFKDRIKGSKPFLSFDQRYLKLRIYPFHISGTPGYQSYKAYKCLFGVF